MFTNILLIAVLPAVIQGFGVKRVLLHGSADIVQEFQTLQTQVQSLQSQLSLIVFTGKTMVCFYFTILWKTALLSSETRQGKIWHCQTRQRNYGDYNIKTNFQAATNKSND